MALSNNLEGSYFYGKEWDEIHCFEPLPWFNADYVKEKSELYMFDQFSDMHFHNKAVWIKNETISFYEHLYGRHFGSSVNPQKDGNKKEIKVDGIDFNEWLLNNFSKEDYIFVDMDIECSEYPVVNHMIDGGSIDLIDELAVEWHHKKCGSWYNWKELENSINPELDKTEIKILNHDDIGFGPNKIFDGGENK